MNTCAQVVLNISTHSSNLTVVLCRHVSHIVPSGLVLDKCSPRGSPGYPHHSLGGMHVTWHVT